MERLTASISRYLMYIVVAYVLVDYTLRNLNIPIMVAKLWDGTLLILIVGAWIIYAAVKEIKPMGSRLLIPMLLFYATVLLNFFLRSSEPGIAMMELRSLILHTFWFFVAYNVLSSKVQFKNILDIFMLVGFIVAMYGIYQYLTGAEIPSTWVDRAETDISTRAFSFIGSPNVLGSFLILQISVALASFMASYDWLKKRLYLFAGLICTLCLVFTLSRGAWIVFFFVLVLLGFWLDKRLILGLIIISLITPVAVPAVYSRIAYMASPEYVQSAAEGGRIARWSQAMDYWKGQPLTGLGMGRFGGGVAIASFPGSGYSVDNFYLKLGTEMGIIGLAAFIFLIISALGLARSALQKTKDKYLKTVGTGLMAGLIGVLAHNMSENMFEFPLMAVYFWFFLGLIIALPHLNGSQQEVEPND